MWPLTLPTTVGTPDPPNVVVSPPRSSTTFRSRRRHRQARCVSIGPLVKGATPLPHGIARRGLVRGRGRKGMPLCARAVLRRYVEQVVVAPPTWAAGIPRPVQDQR
jgi:hypothetical protein